MDAYRFQVDSWLHVIHATPRFLHSCWPVTLLFIGGYFCSQYLSPQVATWESWYTLSETRQLAWYASSIMIIVFPLVMTITVLRFICRDAGIELSPGYASTARFLVAYALIYTATGLGLMLLIIPGILLWTCTLLVPILILAHDYKLWEALFASFDAVKGHIWKISLGFLPIIALIVALHWGLLYWFESAGWDVAAHLLNALVFPLSVIISASYTLVLYSHTEYRAAREPHGLKVN